MKRVPSASKKGLSRKWTEEFELCTVKWSLNVLSPAWATEPEHHQTTPLTHELKQWQNN